MEAGQGLSFPFSHRSVIGNLVTVLNLKFWHLCGAAIHLLARHPAQGFSRNLLMVPNTTNIYIHRCETKFTSGFWGWLRDSLIPDFRVFSCLPESSRDDAQPGAHWLPSLQQLLIYRACLLGNKSPLLLSFCKDHDFS